MTDKRTESDSPRTLQTSTTTLQVIDALKDLDGATVTEMADYLDLSKGGVYNHLATLRENDFVVKDNNVYQLSPRFILIGEHVRQESLLYQFGREEVNTLVNDTGEYAQLITERHGRGIVLYLQRGEKAIGSSYPNQMERKPLGLHHLSAGKAILSRLPESRVNEIIDRRGLPQRTNNTITSREELFDELETIRERGFALNVEEEVDGLRAVGAAINGPDGEVLGAISLSGPKSRMQGERFNEEIPRKVMDAADVIEVNINMYTQSNET